jgi:hypothetical protein
MSSVLYDKSHIATGGAGMVDVTIRGAIGGTGQMLAVEMRPE